MLQKKIKFTGFPKYHDPHDQPYYRFLSDRYDLRECDDPDYVIDGGQDFEHVNYDAIKVLICSENEVPDFNTYDYAVASSHIQFGDRYVRVPWYAFSPLAHELSSRPAIDDISLLNRGFCSFVVSNSEFADPIRKRFFDELSRYKKIASGGSYLNNVGEKVKDKMSFCRGFKFNIAFENSSCPGYVTEKIVDAYAAHSVPIYFGSPDIKRDFCETSMVYVSGVHDISRAIDEVIMLDKDDKAYMERVSGPCFKGGNAKEYSQKLEEFLCHIFDQPLSEARRLCPYGHQAMMRRHLRYVHGIDYKIGRSLAYRFAVSVAGKIRALRRG